MAILMACTKGRRPLISPPVIFCFAYSEFSIVIDFWQGNSIVLRMAFMQSVKLLQSKFFIVKQLSITTAVFITIFISHLSFAQKGPDFLKNDTIKVWGNCESCKARIENAAKAAGAATAHWYVDSQTLAVSFDEAKTSAEKIQKAIAKKGHDTKDFAATAADYNKLPGCCQYPRKEVKQ
jgi:copper chaperone CopZ